MQRPAWTVVWTVAWTGAWTVVSLRPSAADRLLAAAVFLLGVAIAVAVQTIDIEDERPLDGWAVLLLAAMAAPLVVRRRWPLAVVLAVLVASAPYHLLDHVHEATTPATLVAAFTVALYSEPSRRAAAGLVAAGAVVVQVIAASGAPGDALLGVGWLSVAFLAGLAIRFHRNWKTAVAERLEQERADEVERRVAEERVLIAAELHDVLAHGLAAANVQASVAAHLIDQLPDRGDTSLQALSTTLHDLSDTSRATLHELRAVLDVLHGGDAEPTGPAPHLGELPRLVEIAEAAGVRVEVAGRELVAEPPATVSVVAYRIIQEALANVARHSAAGHATVRLEEDGDRLQITVTDPGPARASSLLTPAGFGIAGMTGRARAVGGELSAGPDGCGGFQVRASLPVHAGLPAPEPRRVRT